MCLLFSSFSYCNSLVYGSEMSLSGSTFKVYVFVYLVTLKFMSRLSWALTPSFFFNFRKASRGDSCVWSSFAFLLLFIVAVVLCRVESLPVIGSCFVSLCFEAGVVVPLACPSVGGR